MTRRTVRLISLVALSLCLVLATACSKSKAPEKGGTHIASVSEIEAQLHHQIAEPATDSGATLIKSGYGEDVQGSTISLFAAKSAVISYQWHGFTVLVRQGKPKGVSALRTMIQQMGAVTSTGTDGSEISVVPAAGKAPPLAFRLIGDWLITVNVAAAPPLQAATDDVRAFVASMTFRP